MHAISCPLRIQSADDVTYFCMQHHHSLEFIHFDVIIGDAMSLFNNYFSLHLTLWYLKKYFAVLVVVHGEMLEVFCFVLRK